ncbi:dipeptide ABC transporter ATP-binding protein [Leucobacter chromiiresistens]|uniref:Peptide/nickel transport system ATP-binding protein n=1 Tax=Leucobacter chromiiresistens TaxID=1079994 RepID=A0A1H1A134_9MICO|nr:ABC transporter ATP-binding protein [Leucobacter chromiiresistens]SDQ33369.1 peptide/nickel transport system ATP-binding protein [Leucobacter chromiiresistens]
MSHDSDAKRPANILEFSRLSLEYRSRARPPVSVITDISFSLRRGEVLALVGESGSGKSTIARAVTGTLAPNARITQGSVVLDSTNLVDLPAKQYERLRGRTIGYVPQDALLGLNPLLTVGKQAAEPLRVHTRLDRAARKRRVLELFERVGLRRVEQVYNSYPHELSGGMCQRVLIAAAIAAEPALIVADEPTTALDVTVQKRILDLLGDLTRDNGLSVLLVTHDLGVAAERAQRIAVLQHGRLVETGPSELIVSKPIEAYTRRLIDASHLARPTVAIAEARAAQREDAQTSSLGTRGGAVPMVLASRISKTFSNRTGAPVAALDDVSLSIARGRTLGIVGESGSGKTTLMRTLAGLTQPDEGDVCIGGQPLSHDPVAKRARRELYRTLQIVYQNPYAALNPRLTAGRILEEPLTGFGFGGRAERRRRIAELLDLTELPASVAGRYTAELSGGQRQRIAIARALAVRPEVLICDEPVSALDVTVQRQILDLLDGLQRELGLTYLVISHDLGVISEISDEILVLQHGQVVESGTALDVLRDARTDYVRELIAAIPQYRTPWNQRRN